MIVLRRFWDKSHADRVRIALLALVVFVLDTVAGLDILFAVLYVNVVLLAMRSGRRTDVVVAGWGSVGLTIVSFLLTVRPSVPFASALVNTCLSVLAIICVMVLCLRNIRSQAEILRAHDRIALVSRGVFLKTISASVVHEVTQPITAIGANAEAARRWLDQSPPNLEETRTATRRIVAEVGRISDVVTRLRRSMATGEVSVRTCDVLALVENAVRHFHFELGSEGIDVALACPPNLAIAADGVLIEQVVMNALSNSIDALRMVDANERSIAIGAKPLQGRVQISISDSGPGVDETTLAQIFDPFFTTKAGYGMGIGLAVSRSIIDAQQGTIRASARVPRGLVIEVTLPTPGA